MKFFAVSVNYFAVGVQYFAVSVKFFAVSIKYFAVSVQYTLLCEAQFLHGRSNWASKSRGGQCKPVKHLCSHKYYDKAVENVFPFPHYQQNPLILYLLFASFFQLPKYYKDMHDTTARVPGDIFRLKS